MSTNTPHRYFDIKAFTIGSTVYTTIKGVSIDQDTAEIADAGDGDTDDSFLAKGKRTTRVSIEINDPVQAKALSATNGSDVTFQGSPQAGGVAVQVTLSGFVGFKLGTRGNYNQVYTGSVSGRCVKSDGSDPYAVAPAA